MKPEAHYKLLQTGFSLSGLLVCTGIAALLLALSQPSLRQINKQTEIRRISRDFITALETARITAITEGTFVTFCRSADSQTCSGQWHQGAMAFTDHNKDRVVDANDRVIVSVNQHPTVHIRLRAFGNRQFLQFTPRGLMHYQSGRMTFCPADKDSTVASQLIINATGRVRLARDHDNDGIVENATGGPINCQ